MGESPAPNLGNLLQRESGSHAFTVVSPSTVTETPCTQLLFQQPPPRLFLPPISTEGQAAPADTGILRHSCQAPRQGLYREGDFEPSLQAHSFERLESVRNAEVPIGTPQDYNFTHSWAPSAFYPSIKREESDLSVPLSRHPRELTGIFGQTSTPMSEEYSHSTGLQDYSLTSELVTEASIASSSRLVSSPMTKLRTSATGGYSHFSNLDTSASAADFTQNDETSFPAARITAVGIADENFGETRKNDETGPHRSKKQRTAKGRERVRIALAPDQPPTTQGKPRERVYVACQQCRNRKIRCDGAKPMCHNCNQRGTGICEFDPIPKRRGPDRLPGARQRHGKVPGPRRRRTRNDKEGAPVLASGDISYSPAKSSNDLTAVPSNDQNSTWAQVPSPQSSTSTNGHRYGMAPGSSGSDASQAHPDYRSLLTPSFAYNAPQDSYNGNTAFRPDPDPRAFISRISTDPIVLSNSGPMSGTLSPETPSSLPYSAAPTSFGTHFNAYASTPPSLVSEEARASSGGMAKLDSSMSSESLGFGDYVPRGLNPAQPVAVEQEHSLPSTYTNTNIFATAQSENPDYLAEARTMHTRRDSMGNVTSDSYNPYQWAVHHVQYQDVSTAYIPSPEDEEGVVLYEFAISRSPSLDFVRKTWWDSLLDTYCAEPYCTPIIAAHYQIIYNVSAIAPVGTVVTGSVRQRVAQVIVHDLQSTFKDSNFWFSFFNVQLFFRTLFKARETMQPALVLALLMWANYLRSSMAELASEGLRRTLWLKEKAQAALDASVNSSWVDPGLAQAAWLIALFELSSQPSRSVPRMHSALSTLDNIIHALSLTYIDAEDSSFSVPSKINSSAYRTSSMAHGNVSHILPMPLYNRNPIAEAHPRVKFPSQLLQYHSPHRDSLGLQHVGAPVQPPPERTSTCICNELTLGNNWVEAKDYVPFWVYSPAWNPAWTDAEIRREECRRLCWKALYLFAGYTTYRTSVGLPTLDLFLLHPSNVHNILPGENLTELCSPPFATSNLDTVWALYARAILLWHACLRIQNVSERERAIFARSVWLEADAIENELDGHTCCIERAMLYHGREYLFNTRMYVSSEFRRFVPHPSPEMSGAVHRRMAEEWLTHQATLAKRTMHGLQSLTGLRGNVLAKRPFFCYWFMGHMSRCLQLWQADKSLTVALELAKNFLYPINYLSALWPCEEQRGAYGRLLDQLQNACREAGLAPPPPVDPTFPLPTNLIALP